MSKNPKPSFADALPGPTEDLELPADMVQAAFASAQTAGRARGVDIGATHPAQVAKAIQAPALVPVPAPKGVKLTVELPEDVWEDLKNYITAQRRQGVRTSGQKVMASLVTNFLKNQA
jgi:hypothetical protein